MAIFFSCFFHFFPLGRCWTFTARLPWKFFSYMFTKLPLSLHLNAFLIYFINETKNPKRESQLPYVTTSTWPTTISVVLMSVLSTILVPILDNVTKYLTTAAWVKVTNLVPYRFTATKKMNGKYNVSWWGSQGSRRVRWLIQIHSQEGERERGGGHNYHPLFNSDQEPNPWDGATHN